MQCPDIAQLSFEERFAEFVDFQMTDLKTDEYPKGSISVIGRVFIKNEDGRKK